MSNKESKGRFTVGQQYLFIAEKFIKGEQRFGRRFLPWEDTFTGLQCVVLECISEHDVPGDWDDEVKYKGYQFKLLDSNLGFAIIKPGLVFHNQFPRASYGQISTDADYYAAPHVTTTEEFKAFLDAGVGGSYGHFEEASQLVNGIYHGIREIGKEENDQDAGSKIEALKEYLSKTIEPAFDKMNFKVEVSPLVLEFTDGSPSETTDIMVGEVKPK